MTKNQFMKLLCRVQQAQQMIVGEPGIYMKLETTTSSYGTPSISAAIYEPVKCVPLLSAVVIYLDDDYYMAKKNVGEMLDLIRKKQWI